MQKERMRDSMDSTQQSILAAIDEKRADIIAFGKSIKGEKGFSEWDTSQKMQAALESLALTVQTGLAVTGVRASLSSAQSGEKQPRVAIIGELDGIFCPEHPQANPENGVSHACGHAAQLAAVYGAAIALCVPQVREKLCGTVDFFAVPAEEALPKAELAKARARGVEYCCGKAELIRTGAFDDTDLALVSHVHMVQSDADLLLGFNAALGFVSKTVIFHGKAAHAAQSPWNGANALSAATLALSAIGLLREGFPDADCVRMHSNIIDGGKAVNVIPDTVTLEAMIRAKSIDGIKAAAEKFDKAMHGAAMAMGCKAEIIDHQGYMPMAVCPPMDVQKAAAGALPSVKVDCADTSVINFASTDVGDLSHIMPVLAFSHGGVTGALHSADFAIENEETAYILPAKLFALEAYELLKDGARAAKELLATTRAPMTKAEYIAAVEHR